MRPGIRLIVCDGSEEVGPRSLGRVAGVVPRPVAGGGRDVGTAQCIERRQNGWSDVSPFHRVELLQWRAPGSRRHAVPGPERLIDLDDLRDGQIAPCETSGNPVSLEVVEVTPEPDDHLAAVQHEAEAP